MLIGGRQNIDKKHSSGGGSVADYVQDSALLFFDGIENVDVGTHSSTATAWKNFGTWGGSAVASSGLSGSWEADGFSFTDDVNGGFIFDLSNVTWTSGPITIETVFKLARAGKYAGRVFGVNQINTAIPGYRKARLALQTNLDSSMQQAVTCIWGWDWGFNVQLEGSAIWPKNYTFAFGGSTTAAGGFYRWRGQTTTVSTQGYYPSVKGTQLVIGNEGNMSRPLLGEVCAFRLHSRRLTDAEIDYNAKLDRARFDVK